MNRSSVASAPSSTAASTRRTRIRAERGVAAPGARRGALRYLVSGGLFGLVLIKAEVVSWYRIQEMFRFQSFHMYGVIGSAVLVAAVSLWLIRRLGVRTVGGEVPHLPAKAPGWRNRLFGGTLFGLGWAATGACPGPIYALIGAGIPGFALVLVAALAGAWLYGALRARLPH